MRGLSLWLLGSEEAERFSLARARLAGESGGVHGAEGGWKSSECGGGGVSVTRRRSSESTVSIIIPSVSVLSTVTPLTLHWLSASSTWGRKWRNTFKNENKIYCTDLIKFLPVDLVLLCVDLLVAGDRAELRVCSRLEELVLNFSGLHAVSIYCRNNTTTSQSSGTFSIGQNNRMDDSSSCLWGIAVQTRWEQETFHPLSQKDASYLLKGRTQLMSKHIQIRESDIWKINLNSGTWCCDLSVYTFCINVRALGKEKKMERRDL